MRITGGKAHRLTIRKSAVVRQRSDAMTIHQLWGYRRKMDAAYIYTGRMAILTDREHMQIPVTKQSLVVQLCKKRTILSLCHV